MAPKSEKRLVASYKKLSFSSFGESEQVIVVRIGGNRDVWRLFDDDGDVAKAD